MARPKTTARASRTSAETLDSRSVSFREIDSRLKAGGWLVVTARTKPRFYVVSASEYRRLTRRIKALEDAADRKTIDRRRGEPREAWEAVKDRLRLNGN